MSIGPNTVVTDLADFADDLNIPLLTADAAALDTNAYYFSYAGVTEGDGGGNPELIRPDEIAAVLEKLRAYVIETIGLPGVA